MYEDYFAEDSTYTDEQFRRQFRMSRRLFLRVLEGIQRYHDYFEQKTDAAQRPGFSPIQKVSVAIRQLAYGLPADTLDESFRMAESTALECLRRFCAAVIAVFGEEYLRTPNEADVKRLLEEERQEVFPECLYLLTVCTGSGKTAPLLGMVSSLARRRRQQLSLKQLHLMTCGSGMRFSVFLDL